MIKDFFPTKELWIPSNPLLLAERFLERSFPPIYLSTGTNDEFGFFAKSKEFAAKAKEKGARLIWDATEETHARYDPVRVADFIAE